MTTKAIYALIIIATLSTGCTAEHDIGESEYRQNVCLWLSQAEKPEIERSGWPPFKGVPEGCE